MATAAVGGINIPDIIISDYDEVQDPATSKVVSKEQLDHLSLMGSIIQEHVDKLNALVKQQYSFSGIRRNAITEEVLATSLALSDLSFGMDVNNVIRAKFLTENVVGDSDPIGSMEDYGFFEGRSYMTFFDPNTDSSCFILINNPETDEESISFQYLNGTTGLAESISKEDLNKLYLSLNGGVLIAFPNKTPSSGAVDPFIEAQQYVFNCETEDKEVGEASSELYGKFYQVNQFDNAYCAIYAANTFLGKTVLTPTLVTEMNRVLFSEMLGLTTVSGLEKGPEAPEELSGELIDARNGASPHAIKELIVSLSGQDKPLPEKYRNLIYTEVSLNDGKLFMDDPESPGEKVELTREFFDAIDRVLLGESRPDHSLAFRKTSKGTWTRLDSYFFQKSNPQPTKHPYDEMLEELKEKLNTKIHFTYIKPGL